MRIVALETTAAGVRIARAERRTGRVRIVSLTRLPTLELPDTTGAHVLTALPASAVTARVLAMPFRDHRRLAATVPLELLGHLPSEPAGTRVVFTTLATSRTGAAVLAVAVRDTDVEALRADRIDVAPLPVWNLVDPAHGDATIVLADGDRSAVTVRRDGTIASLYALATRPHDGHAFVAEAAWAVRALGATPLVLVTGPDADPSLREQLADACGTRCLGLREVTTVPLPDDAPLDACAVVLGLAVGCGHARPRGIDVRAPKAPAPRGHTRIVALAAIAACLALVDLGLVRLRLVRHDATLTRAMATAAADALPGVRLVAPRAQLALAAEQAGVLPGGVPRASALDGLREIVERAPDGVVLDTVVIEPHAMELRGHAPGQDGVDGLRRSLAASPALVDVTIQSTHEAGSRTTFTLRAARRPHGGTHS